MLTAPEDFSQDVLVSTLAHGWKVTVASMTYRPVGFGSHHWEVTDVESGRRWFATVDELETKRQSRLESLDAAFDRLRAALASARALRDRGHSFVVAPAPTRDGEPLVRMTDQLTLALYPFVEGRSFDWGEFSTPTHRRAVLDLLIAVHTAGEAVHQHARADDFVIPHRDQLEAALTSAAVADCGPYAGPTSLLVSRNAAALSRLLARYDELVERGRAQPTVLTHGEPHPGNTMRTAGGWLLIDWDTALIAPPERDLWGLDPGDGSVLGAYADATGVTPLPAVLELYRTRWDLADIAVDVSRFRRHHTGNLDDEKSWDILRSLIDRVSL